MKNIYIPSIILVLLVSACGADAAPESEENRAFDQFMESLVETAQNEGASDGQLALLSDAASEGEITFNHVRQAQDLTFGCFDEAGIDHQVNYPGDADTFRSPQYLFMDGGDQLTMLADECIDRHSFFVEMAFESQPVAQAAEDAAIEAVLPEIIECLEGQGYTFADDVTVDEVRTSMRLPIEELTPLIEQGLPLPAECFAMAGVDSF